MDAETFGKRLHNLLLSRGISQSDLAAKIWGRYKDNRGFDVARNRDRISIYLKGASMPDAPNLKKIADALSMTVHELLDDAPNTVTTTVDYNPLTAMDQVPGEAHYVFLRLHRKMKAQDAARVIGMVETMLAEDAPVPRLPLSGGGK